MNILRFCLSPIQAISTDGQFQDPYPLFLYIFISMTTYSCPGASVSFAGAFQGAK